METDYENPLYSITIHGITLRVLKKSRSLPGGKKIPRAQLFRHFLRKSEKTAVAKPTLVGVTYAPKLTLCGQAPDAITTVDLPLHLRKHTIFLLKNL